MPVPALQAILEATQLKDDPQSSVQRVVVTGCMAQRYAGDLREAIPEADLFVGFQNYDGLPASIREALAAPGGDAARPAKRQRVQVGPLGLQPLCIGQQKRLLTGFPVYLALHWSVFRLHRLLSHLCRRPGTSPIAVHSP